MKLKISKKKFGGIIVSLAVIAIGISVLMKALNIYRWTQIDFYMVSYHPLVPVLGLTSAGILLLLSFLGFKKNNRHYWYIFMASFAVIIFYNLLLLYGVLKTYGGVI